MERDWQKFVREQQESDLAALIADEKLKPEETRKFITNAFRDGSIKTTGTDTDKILPPVSRFGGGARAEKKQNVIDKLKAFFEKYFGLGINSFAEEKKEQKELAIEPVETKTEYIIEKGFRLGMVAETQEDYSN